MSSTTTVVVHCDVYVYFSSSAVYCGTVLIDGPTLLHVIRQFVLQLYSEYKVKISHLQHKGGKEHYNTH